MIKKEFVKKLSDKLSISIKQSKEIIETYIDLIEEEVSKGNRVVLNGFGTYYSRMMKARIGRNPKTGERVRIKAKNLPAFKPGKRFKDRVAGNTKSIRGRSTKTNKQLRGKNQEKQAQKTKDENGGD